MAFDLSLGGLHDSSLRTDQNQYDARNGLIRVRAIEDCSSGDCGETGRAKIQLISCSDIGDRAIDAALGVLKCLRDRPHDFCAIHQNLDWEFSDASFAVLLEEDIEIFCRSTTAPEIPRDRPTLQLAFIPFRWMDAPDTSRLWADRFERLRAANFVPVICNPDLELNYQYSSMQLPLISLLSIILIEGPPCVDFYDIAYAISQRRATYVKFCSVREYDSSNLSRWIDKKSIGCLAVFSPNYGGHSVMDEFVALNDQIHDAIDDDVNLKVTCRYLDATVVGSPGHCVHIFQSLQG